MAEPSEDDAVESAVEDADEANGEPDATDDHEIDLSLPLATGDIDKAD